MLATYCWRQLLAKIKGKRRQSSLFDTVYCNFKKYYFYITNVVFEFNTFSLTLMGDRAI